MIKSIHCLWQKPRKTYPGCCTSPLSPYKGVPPGGLRSSLIILISRRRSFCTTRIWTSQFLSHNLPDDWIHRRKEIQNSCLEITRVTVERGRSGNYTENKTGLYIDRVKIKLDCVKKIKLDRIKIKLDCINIKTGLCKTITGLSKTNTGLWLSWAIVALRTIRYFATDHYLAYFTAGRSRSCCNWRNLLRLVQLSISVRVLRKRHNRWISWPKILTKC